MGARVVQGLEAVSRVSVPESVRREASRIVGDGWFFDGQADKLAYGRDCWPLGILWTRGGKLHRHLPDFVVMPGSLDEVVALVRLARESGTPVIAYGAGSGVCGGTLASKGGFTLDVKRLNAMRKLDPVGLTVRVGTGAIGMHLETDLNRRGFTMGHYPSSLYCSSLGGYLAARSAGQLSSRFGKIDDMCFSLEAVLGSGEVIESSHWQPDLTQVLIGSEGTLGVITEATMRIEPIAEERVYRGFRFPAEELALDAIRRLIQAGFRPAVVRLYDKFDSLLAGKGKEEHGPEAGEPSMLRELRHFVSGQAFTPVSRALRRAGEALLRRAVGSPLLLNRAVSMLPGGCLLILGFEGPRGLTVAEAEAAFERLRSQGDDLGPGPGEHWYENRFGISYKQSPTMDMGLFVDTMEVSTTWDNLHHLYRAVREAVGRQAFIMAHFSHVYPEGSSIYFTFAGFAAEGDPIERLYERTWEVALEAVMRSGSSITHHHGVGLSKARYLSADHHGGLALYRALKARFDPDGIMNPGKLWEVVQAGGEAS